MTTLNITELYANHNAWNVLQIPSANGEIIGNGSAMVVEGQMLNGEYVQFTTAPMTKVRNVKVGNRVNASLEDSAIEVKVVQEVTVKKNKKAAKARVITVTLQTEIFRTSIGSHTNIWLD